MTRLFNDPVNFPAEFLLGLVAAYPSQLRAVPGGTCVVSTSAPTEQVCVVIGGGSGHYPAFCRTGRPRTL
jgi:dihydroxyacetone kinase